MLKMKSINKVIFIFFSLFVISYILYARLIMIRLPKTLLCTQETFPFYLFSLGVLICIFLFKIYTYKFSETAVSAKSRIQKIIDKFQFDYFLEYYTMRLKKCHEFLIDKIEYMDNVLNFLLNLILKHYLILRIFYFGLTYGPRYFLSLIFLIESIIFHKLSLFYSCIPILFIPLLGQYMLFAVKNFIETNLEYLNNCLEVEIIVTETQKYKVNAQIYNEYILSLDPADDFKAFLNLNEQTQEYLKKQGRDILEETKVVVDLFYSLVNFNHLWAYLNTLKLNYNFYLQTGSIIIYIISWVYIILYTGEGSTEILKLLNQIIALASKEEPFSGLLID